MKKVLICVFFFCSSVCLAKVPAINEVRLMFHKATLDEDACKDLINLLMPFDEINNPLLFGYKGSAIMMMAKHVFNPFSKLSYFKKGKNILESAIQADQKNVELRFLRYTIQTNIPSFLNYDNNVESDKAFLTKSLSKLNDMKLKKIISSYLKNSNTA